MRTKQKEDYRKDDKKRREMEDTTEEMTVMEKK